MISGDWTARQRELCQRFGAPFVEAPLALKLGLARNVGTEWPVHGLRHPPQGDTSGWYIWTGDLSSDADFFKPIHVSHLVERVPIILPFLGLAPGWRFLIAPDHEDVWEDESLLLI
jgi:hypothetical protein